MFGFTTRLQATLTNSPTVEIKSGCFSVSMKRLDGVCDHRQAEPGAPMVNNKSFMGHDKQYDYARRRFGDIPFCPEYETAKESHYCKKNEEKSSLSKMRS